jgi:DNA modification methylase
VAAAIMGRKYLGIELDEKYLKIAEARIKEL